MAVVIEKFGEISKLTDEKLKEALQNLGETIGPITSSTRELHERLLKRKHEENLFEKSDNDVDGGMGSGKSQKVFAEDNFSSADQRNSEAHVYFGVYVPDPVDDANDTDFQKVYLDQTACLAAMKKYRGSRFKSFGTYDAALQFAENGPDVIVSHGTASGEDGGPSSSINAEKPSPFRGPKSQDLVKFRKAIEKCDMDYFTQCIDENPRYLVSSGDTPAILQEGFRYNALHVACRTNRPTFVEKVLATVSQAEFFQKLYPDDALESSERRSSYLLDLYLNTPDKGLNETPLHFASKHGCVECVRILTTYPACNKSRNNKFGQKPIDIVCSRMKENNSIVAKDIHNLLGDLYYVPLYRDDDHCLLPQVGTPWSPSLDMPTSPISQDQLLTTFQSPISPSLKVRGYAGPMSPTQAEAFHRLWRSTSTSSPTPRSSIRIASLRLTDQDKGLERLGRKLAAEKDVGWNEYWDFLGEFANLATDEGLLKLETYLKQKFKQLLMERGELDVTDLARRLIEEQNAGENVQDTSQELQEECCDNKLYCPNISTSSRSTMSELCQDLEALRLNVSLSPHCHTPSQDIISASSKFLESCRHKEIKPENSPKVQKIAEVEQETAGQQLSYIIKSVDVASNRLAEIMGDLAKDLQSNTVANLYIAKTVRTKLKPEILCLKNVVSKCTKELKDDINLSFIHILLATKVTDSIQQNLMPSDICVLAETMKTFVSHLNFVQLDSSDEEETAKPNAIIVEKLGSAQHCTCVLQCLDKALNIAYNNCSMEDNVDNKKNMKLSLMQLGECTCRWNVTASAAYSAESKPPSVVTTKYTKAFRYLHETLFSEAKRSVKASSRHEDSVIKQLTFTEEEEEEGNYAINVIQSVSRGDKEGDEEDVGACTTTTPPEEGAEQDDDSDSFATAASTIEDLMVTPEEGVKVYINGVEASKVDVDVLAAIGERELDEMKYPYVCQWRHLISSYSDVQRDSWPSPYCSRIRHSSPANTAPSKLSLPNTPMRLRNLWIPSSTPRVLFGKMAVHPGT
ncbi:ankyrin repeat and LEM domain-containing protein 2 homolog [Procambarus clarkii]|uniref:ankyrin repeat and LEM domain-containing protein 2 homolog n=1 Tax=Procambarus clarkii TaxID=6728 RepID=UPI003743379F